MAMAALKPLGPVHKKEVPLVGDTPFKVTDCTTQVMEPLVAVAPGGVLLAITTAVRVAVQPVTPSVTVRK